MLFRSVSQSRYNEGATQRARAILKSALQFMVPSAEQWTVPIRPVSVVAQHGIEETAVLVEEFFAVSRLETRAHVRAEQRKQWFDAALNHELLDMLLAQARATTLLSAIRSQSISGELPPTVAVHRLLAHLQLSITEQT